MKNETRTGSFNGGVFVMVRTGVFSHKCINLDDDKGCKFCLSFRYSLRPVKVIYNERKIAEMT